MTKSRGTKAITAILISMATVLSFAACEAEEQLIETAGTTTTEVTVEAPVQETSAEDFNYSEIDGGIRIDKYTENDKEVVIPAMIDGKPVTMIGDSAFQQNETVESVTIPDSVEVIGERAFMLCWALENVTLPDHAVKIGGDSFATTPWFDKMREENPPLIVNGTLISGDAGLMDAAIPDGVQWIAGNAFYYCGFTSVTIPDSVTRIGGYAFSQCDKLASVTLGSGVTEIGDHAFSGSRLTSITIPDSMTVIGDHAFSGCDFLTSVTIPDSVTEISDGAFSGCGLTSVTIPDGVIRIGNYAFSDCGALKSVTLPDGLKSLGKGAFNGGMTVAYRGKDYVFPTQRDDLYEAINGAE